MRFEIEMVQRDVSHQVDAPVVVRLQGHIGLIVEEQRVILTFSVLACQQRIVLFQSGTVYLRELAGILAEHHASPHQACGYCPLQCLRLTICYVQSRRHFVGISGRESTRREFKIADHVRVDDTEAFLLAGAYQLGPIHLHAVDVHRILVECASAHGILR